MQHVNTCDKEKHEIMQHVNTCDKIKDTFQNDILFGHSVAPS